MFVVPVNLVGDSALGIDLSGAHGEYIDKTSHEKVFGDIDLIWCLS